MAEWKEHECVFTYLTEKKYDEGTTKAEKRRIREKAQSFVVQEGVLYHKNHNNVLSRNRKRRRKAENSYVSAR